MFTNGVKFCSPKCPAFVHTHVRTDHGYYLVVLLCSLHSRRVSRSITISQICFTFLFSVPSAAPSSVGVSKVTSSTVSVQWGPVECVHQNGDITGYSLQYGETGNTNIKTTIFVPGASATETTITNLVSNTSYEISIAATNSEGAGPRSTALSAQTLVEGILLLFVELANHHFLIHSRT